MSGTTGKGLRLFARRDGDPALKWRTNNTRALFTATGPAALPVNEILMERENLGGDKETLTVNAARVEMKFTNRAGLFDAPYGPARFEIPLGGGPPRFEVWSDGEHMSSGEGPAVWYRDNIVYMEAAHSPLGGWAVMWKDPVLPLVDVCANEASIGVSPSGEVTLHQPNQVIQFLFEDGRIIQRSGVNPLVTVG